MDRAGDHRADPVLPAQHQSNAVANLPLRSNLQ
jgi:hypothetical protein